MLGDRTGGLDLVRSIPEFGEPRLEVQDLHVRFKLRGSAPGVRRRSVDAVTGVRFDIEPGETVGLVGESGSGKTSLARAVLRLQPAVQGTVSFGGVDITELRGPALRALRRRMQYILQDPYASLDSRMDVRSILSEPLTVHKMARGKERNPRILELLGLVGLAPEYADRYPHEMSGGQRQRVGIAQALAVNPDFVVCDEPVASLDVSAQAQVLNLLMDLRDRLGLTMLFIAHDLGTVRRISSRVLVMYLGGIVETGPTEAVFNRPRHPYTQALLSAALEPNPVVARSRERIVLHGDPPSAEERPGGCAFHPRCWLYERKSNPELCRTITPPALQLEGQHSAACHFAEELDAVTHTAALPQLDEVR